MHYSKRIKCCYFVIASDQRERCNLASIIWITGRLLRRFAPRNDTLFNAFVVFSTLSRNGQRGSTATELEFTRREPMPVHTRLSITGYNMHEVAPRKKPSWVPI